MDAYIARGGISHVLSQARASLKNPSRPYTPRTTARPLFHGDDYRPGSRPSSSYTVAELKHLQSPGQIQASAPSPTPKTKLPPRPTRLTSRPPRAPSSSCSATQRAEPELNSLAAAKPQSSSSSSFKLVHAPVLTAEEAQELLEAATSDSDEEGADKALLDPEASLSLPSRDELQQKYDEIQRCMLQLDEQTHDPSFDATAKRLSALVDRFVGLSSFFQTPDDQRDLTASTTTQLRLRLFDALATDVLDKWTHHVAWVLQFTPALLALYGTTGADRSSASSVLMARLGKTLFMLSKESANDPLFCDVRYVEAVLGVISLSCSSTSTRQGLNNTKHHDEDDEPVISAPEDQVVPMKTLIYTAGTLKNVSNAEDKMVTLLATNRAIAILSDVMRWRVAASTTEDKEIAQLLIQTTGVLRNLAVAKSHHKQFLEARVPARLCGLIPAFLMHQELMVNVSRILSKLTLHELPRAQINEHTTNIQHLITLLDRRQNPWLSLETQQHGDMRSQDLLFVRGFFVLGNLCAGNDRNRLLLASRFSGLDLLLEALQFYAARYSDERSGAADRATGQDADEQHDVSRQGEQSMEVLVKLIRVLANLSINGEVAAALNDRQELRALLEVLEVAQRVGDEELMLNAVSCITNVSYYSTASPNNRHSPGRAIEDTIEGKGFIEQNRVEITRLLSRILLNRNEEAVVEALRAFGNLSRFSDVLACMDEHKVLDCLVVLLDHSNREIVHTVCGVLMNVALHQRSRRALLAVRPLLNDDTTDVRRLLVGIVECAAADDLSMTLIACKTLYNLLLEKDTADDRVEMQRLLTSDAVALRRVVDEVMDVLSKRSYCQSTKSTGRDSNGDSDSDSDSDEADNDSELSGSRQELRLVLPQLRRSLDSVVPTA